MAKVAPISEHFQHFLEDVRESLWGDLYGQTRLAWKKFFEAESQRERDRYLGLGRHERIEPEQRVDYRNPNETLGRDSAPSGCASRERGVRSFCPRGSRPFNGGRKMWRC
jgi:hypothetical protein